MSIGKECKLPRNLFWRGGSIWARIKQDGVERRQCLRTTSVREAERKLQDLKARLREEEEAGERVGFQEAAVEWEASYLSGLSARGAERAMVSLRQLDRLFRHMTLPEITAKAIGKFVSMRTQEGVTNQTIKNDLTALSTILRCAMSRGWIESNPVAAWDRRVLKHKAKVLAPPGQDQIDRTIGYSKTHGKRSLLGFLAATGCRLEEAARLKWEDVDLAAGKVVIHGKRSTVRVVRLRTAGGDAEAVLRACTRHARCAYVFWYSTGIPFRQPSSGLRDFYKRVSDLEAKAGRDYAPFRTHDLRHSFAIRWLNAGGDIYELSRHLGHTSVKTTEQFYLKWMDPDARDRYEARKLGSFGPSLVWDAERHQSGTTAVSEVPSLKKAKV